MKLAFFGGSRISYYVLEELEKSGIKPDLHFKNGFDKERLKELAPDICLLCAFGKIIPKDILEIPQRSFINIHPSLLPRWRGPSPIQYAISHGDKETGVTLFLMDEKVDHGPILAQEKIAIDPKDNQLTVEEKLGRLGGKLFVKTLPDYLSGKIQLTSQVDNLATYSKKLKREDGRIDWAKSDVDIERQIRAFYGWPGTFTYVEIPGTNYGEKKCQDSLQGKQNSKLLRLKIIEAEFLKEKHAEKAGKLILKNSDNGINKILAIACGKGFLMPKTLQFEGRKPISNWDFLNGYRDLIGTSLK